MNKNTPSRSMLRFAAMASCLVTARCCSNPGETCTHTTDSLEVSLLQTELRLVGDFSRKGGSHAQMEELNAASMPYGSFAQLELDGPGVVSRPSSLELLELRNSTIVTKEQGPPIFVWLLLSVVVVSFGVVLFMLARSARGLTAADQMHVITPGPTTSTATTLGSPPPICEALVLPKTEARFLVSMENLLKLQTGSLELIGISGKKLLTAVLGHEDDALCLKLSSVANTQEPRAFVFSDHNARGPLRICGSNRTPYGELQAISDDDIPDCALKIDDKEVMRIRVGNAEHLELSVQAMDGKVLASAGRDGRGSFGANESGRGFSRARITTEELGSDPWVLQVCPGVDSVLVACCMLGMITMMRRSPVSL